MTPEYKALLEVYKRQKEELLEDRRENIFNHMVKTLGVSEYAAEKFYKLFGKYAVTMAHKVIDTMSHGKELNKEEKAKIITYAVRNKNQALVLVSDWIKADRGLHGELGKYRSKKYDFTDLVLKSKEWHDSLNSEKGIKDDITFGKPLDEKYKVIRDYRDENGLGYYWVDIEDSYCPEEAARLGNCGNAGDGYTQLILRKNEIAKNLSTKKKKAYRNLSRVVITVNDQTRVAREIKGRFNEVPDEKYRPYIIDLMANTKEVSSFPPYHYLGNLNYYDLLEDDISKEDIKKILDNNDSFIFKPQTVKKAFEGNEKEQDKYVKLMENRIIKTLIYKKGEFTFLNLYKLVASKIEFPESVQKLLEEKFQVEVEKNEVSSFVKFSTSSYYGNSENYLFKRIFEDGDELFDVLLGIDNSDLGSLLLNYTTGEQLERVKNYALNIIINHKETELDEEEFNEFKQELADEEENQEEYRFVLNLLQEYPEYEEIDEIERVFFDAERFAIENYVLESIKNDIVDALEDVVGENFTKQAYLTFVGEANFGMVIPHLEQAFEDYNDDEMPYDEDEFSILITANDDLTDLRLSNKSEYKYQQGESFKSMIQELINAEIIELEYQLSNSEYYEFDSGDYNKILESLLSDLDIK